MSALVTGDFEGDSCDDLAVGTDEVQLDDDDEAFVGEVRIIYGSPRGLVKARSQVWLPSVVDGEVPDSADGYFGSELAAADFGNGLFDDLAIGYEHEGQLDKARKAYEKALELDPNNTQVRQNYELFKEINDRTSQGKEQ